MGFESDRCYSTTRHLRGANEEYLYKLFENAEPSKYFGNYLTVTLKQFHPHFTYKTHSPQFSRGMKATLTQTTV